MKYLLIPEEDWEKLINYLPDDYEMNYFVKREDLKVLDKVKNKKYPTIENPFDYEATKIPHLQ